eukprot:scaffold12086_cov67-Phaeocystis_antarctica.AAC.19
MGDRIGRQRRERHPRQHVRQQERRLAALTLIGACELRPEGAHQLLQRRVVAANDVIGHRGERRWRWRREVRSGECFHRAGRPRERARRESM